VCVCARARVCVCVCVCVCSGRAVNTPASYSGGLGPDLGPTTGIVTEVFVVFVSPSRRIPG
jgi:hypothetical protein